MNAELDGKSNYSLRQLVFRSFASAIAPGLSFSSIDFSYNVQANIPDDFLGYPLHIRNLIHDLVRNAISNLGQQSEPGRISLSCNLLERHDDDLLLQFCVHDTGPSVGQEKLGLLFQYFQAEDLMPNDLGINYPLRSALRRVRHIHGNIWVHSNADGGNRAIFTAPSQTVNSSDLVFEFADKKVLFVDSLRDQTGVADQIRNLGCHITVVHVTESLSDKSKFPQPDTVVVDSAATVEQVRVLEHLNWTPIVLLTPSMQSLDLKWCMRNNVLSHQYLTTPISLANLSSALIDAISTRIERPGPSYDVLVAEDNRVNCKLATKILEKYGHKVHLAENGAIAVDVYKKSCGGCEETSLNFDVVLMDLNMPVLDGFQATEQIRKYEKDMGVSPVPIIGLLAGLSLETTRAISAGMNDTLRKPLRSLELIKTIDQLLSEKTGGAMSRRVVPFEFY
ncbi:hypothetical protein VKT23_014995 [Stygiomarasmius scandens]|uniref:Response regulatory domain-containing protein n=1 Tax=Marasmiellus scandens TaxID=2682957 RepID=A0ABR1J293_9AGAR